VHAEAEYFHLDSTNIEIANVGGVAFDGRIKNKTSCEAG